MIGHRIGIGNLPLLLYLRIPLLIERFKSLYFTLEISAVQYEKMDRFLGKGEAILVMRLFHRSPPVLHVRSTAPMMFSFLEEMADMGLRDRA